MTWSRSLSRTLGFSALYVLTTYAGRKTVMDHTSLSLVWPAAGVLAVWFVGQRASRWRALDVAALIAITVVVNMLTGASAALSGFFVVANLVQGLVFVYLFDRWLPGVWRATQPLTHLSELWRLVAAAVISTTASALIGPTGVWLTSGHYSIEGAAVWMARNSVAIVLVGVALRRIGYLLRYGRADLAAAWRALRPIRRFEYAAAIVVSVAAYAVVFGLLDGLPVAFALIVVTIWVALRLHTTFVILHGLLLGTLAVLFTLHGDGPFAPIVSDPIRGLVAQLFVGTVAVVGLALALSRDERDRLVRAATDQAELLAAIVDSMSEGLGVIDAGGRFVLRNPAAARLIGRTSPGDYLAGSDYYGMFQPDGTPIPAADLPYRRALAGEDVVRTDMLIRNPDVPQGRIINLTATKLPDSGHVVTVFHDVTAERRHRDELARFAGVVAHDLMNPLTTIEGWSETVRDALETPGRVDPADGVARIQRAAARMRHLINDLLAYTTGRDAALSPAPVDLGDLVSDIAAGRVDQATGGDTPVPVVTLGQLARVEADPVLTRQLLDNLIGNAVKYTAPGVTPRIAVASAADGRFVRITVSDNGIGIPAGQHDAVFGTFHRAHTGGPYAGTGLGLAICKRIVERHGGTIAAADNPDGPGTRITFTLPAASSPVLVPG